MYRNNEAESLHEALDEAVSELNEASAILEKVTEIDFLLMSVVNKAESLKAKIEDLSDEAIDLMAKYEDREETDHDNPVF